MASALKKLVYDIPEICELTCNVDAGLSDGNHGFGLCVDFRDAAGYETYAKHPKHVEVITKHIKPILVPGSRTAVQARL